MIKKDPQVKKMTSCNPIKKSEITIMIKETKGAIFEFSFTPTKRAIAAMGVKFAG